MRTWVVIYQTNTGKVYGWFCSAASISLADAEFWREMEPVPGKTIKCIAELQSELADAYLALYREKGQW